MTVPTLPGIALLQKIAVGLFLCGNIDRSLFRNNMTVPCRLRSNAGDAALIAETDRSLYLSILHYITKRQKIERGITMEKSIIVNLEPEKSTKNCVKFNEVTANEFMPEKLGSLYVQKSALAEIGFNGGNINVSITTDDNNAEDGDLKFTAEKSTKNTVKFAESVANEWVPEKIGSLYVPKFTLAELGYAGGEIYVNISKAE